MLIIFVNFSTDMNVGHINFMLLYCIVSSLYRHHASHRTRRCHCLENFRRTAAAVGLPFIVSTMFAVDSREIHSI